MNLPRGPLFALHALFGTVVVISLIVHLQEREREVAKVRATAEQEHRETQRMQQENQQLQDLSIALKRNDPYVVELMVRDKLQFIGPGEKEPPPLPAIDKDFRASTK